MLFVVGDYRIPAEVLQSETFISPHTGDILRHLQIEIQVHERIHEPIMELLKDDSDQRLTSTESDGRTTIWNVEQNSYHYSSDSDVRTCFWTVTEREDLKIETLVLDDLELTPYQYDEEIDNGGLIIKARVLLEVQEVDALHSLMRGPEYFQVERKGINSDKKTMRLGHCVWSRQDDVINQELFLVDQVYDEQKRSKGRGPLERIQIRPANVERLLAETNVELETLSEILIEKGILSEEDQRRLHKSAKERSWKVLIGFDRVKDLNEWEA